MVSLHELNALIQGEIVGDKDKKIKGLSRIDFYEPDTLAFIGKENFLPFALQIQDGAILITRELFEKIKERRSNNTFIITENPFAEFVKLLYFFAEKESYELTGISEKATLEEDTEIGEKVYIAPGVFVGKGSKIGNNVKLYPNVYIGRNVIIEDNTIVYANASIMDKCVIGKNCIIHSGVVIGSDGFGFMQDYSSPVSNVKVPQLGNVVIGNNVEIGANSTIDRAMLGSTVLEDNVKLDNLVHIAHNVIIGEGTVMAAQTGIAGSTQIGKRCMFGGQSATVGHIKVADEVKVGGKSAISKNISQKGAVLRGAPAKPLRKQLKIEAILNKLPEIYKKLK